MATYNELMKWLNKITEFPLIEKIPFILLFLAITIDIHILNSSISAKAYQITLPTLLLLALSTIEIMVVEQNAATSAITIAYKYEEFHL
jgi:hypothetical protein